MPLFLRSPKQTFGERSVFGFFYLNSWSLKGSYSIGPEKIRKNYSMKKMLLAFFALVSLGVTAQKNNPAGIPNRGCATAEVHNTQLQNDPGFAEAVRQIDEHALQFANNATNKSAQAIVNIPVVFHVVYNTAAENVSDAILMDQLRILNEDLRKMNSDSSKVPAIWKSMAADSEINLCLAQRDPLGNPTTGITRTSTTVTAFSTNNAMKYTSQGGKDIWDRNQYLNIWVCDLGTSLLGYAQFPGGSAATDGVVIHYRYTGSGGATYPYDKGRTLTHELGHWLNLRHIWGDENNCTGTDQVADTPNQQGENYGQIAPGTIITDNCQTAAPGVNWQNYMDYTDDASMYMFTNGQKTRMQALFATGGARASILNSLGCVPVAADDAAITGISNPTGANCNTSFVPMVTLANKGTNTLTSVTITYNVDGGTNSTFNWTGSLVTGSTVIVNLPSVTVSAGSHTFNAFTSSPNGGTDLLPANDAWAQSFVTPTSATAMGLPFTEGFTSTTFPPVNWTLYNPETPNTWSRVTVGGFGASTGSAKMDNYTGTINISNRKDDLITPAISLSNANSSLKMNFNLAYARYNEGYADTFQIDISSDCGDSWTTVWKKGASALETKVPQTTAFTPTAAQWKADSVLLGSYAGLADVRFRFRNISGSGNNLYLDDINLAYVAPTVIAPAADFSSAATSTCAGSSIAFTDLSNNNPTSWSWSFSGPAVFTSTSQNPTINFTASGIYDVRLIASNSAGSDTMFKASYVTINAIPSAPATSAVSYCVNDIATPLTAAGNSLLWYATSSSTTSSSVAPTPSTTTAGTTNYFVTQTVNGCQSQKAQLPVTVNPDPTAGFTSSLSGGTATFTNSSANGVSYSWDFGDGNASTDANPVHTYTTSNTFTVTLITTNACGSDTSVQSVSVVLTGIEAASEGGVIAFPNPANDILTIRASGEINNQNVALFNSIGKVVMTGQLVKSQDLTLDLTDVAEGIYYLQTQGDVVRTFKITVVR